MIFICKFTNLETFEEAELSLPCELGEFFHSIGWYLPWIEGLIKVESVYGDYEIDDFPPNVYINELNEVAAKLYNLSNEERKKVFALATYQDSTYYSLVHALNVRDDYELYPIEGKTDEEIGSYIFTKYVNERFLEFYPTSLVDVAAFYRYLLKHFRVGKVKDGLLISTNHLLLHFKEGKKQ